MERLHNGSSRSTILTVAFLFAVHAEAEKNLRAHVTNQPNLQTWRPRAPVANAHSEELGAKGGATQAYVPSPLCAPSRSCLASGREIERATIQWLLARTTLPKDHIWATGNGTLAAMLAKMEMACIFRTGGKLEVIKFAPKPSEMYGYYLRNATVTSTAGEKQTAWDAHLACNGKRHAIKLLRNRPVGKPFFMQVNFPGPHDPFVVTAPMHDSVSDGRVWPQAIDDPLNNTPGGSCRETLAPTRTRSRCNYAAELENLDHLFQKIIDEVGKQGELERTVIIVASDHGE
eukprot:2314915-Amphidinium_carterae.1